MATIRKYPRKVSSEHSIYAQSRQLTTGQHKTRDGLTVVHAQNVDEFRVSKLKPESAKKNRKADGQYTRLTAIVQKHQLFIDRDNPNKIYRCDKTSQDRPVMILEKIDDDWFPVVALTTQEIQSLRPFIGSGLIDPDLAVAEKTRTVKRKGNTGNLTTHEQQRLDKHSAKCKNFRSATPRKVAIR